MRNSLKTDLTSSQNFATGALSYTSSTNRRFKLEEVIIHFSVPITETVTVYRDSQNGANYDSIISRRTLVGESDFLFRPQGECNFQSGEEVRVECTNTGLVGIAYLTIKRSEVLI